MICHICGLSNEDVVNCAACEATLVEAPAVDSDDSKALPAGTLLLGGSYLIGSVLNRSNFSITYLGRHTAERRYVVVKEFFPRGCTRTESEVRPPGERPSEDYVVARKAFLVQGQSLSRFRHVNLAAVQACFEENNTAYMAMELVRGKTLQQVVNQRGPLDEETVLRTIREIGSGLERLHGADLLHCDVQPANVMVCATENSPQPTISRTKNSSERVLLIDFGCNQPLQPTTTDNSFDTLILAEPTRIGTPGFAALEQYGSSSLSEHTDIYGLGAVTYFLLTGRAPTPAPDRAQGEVLPSPRDFNPAISRATSNAVMWALELQSGNRPQTVAEFFDGWPRHAAAPLSSDATAHNPADHKLTRRKLRARPAASIGRTPFDAAPRRSLRHWAPRVALASLVGATLAAGTVLMLQRAPQDFTKQYAAMPTYSKPRVLPPSTFQPDLLPAPTQPLALPQVRRRDMSQKPMQSAQPAAPKVLSSALEPFANQSLIGVEKETPPIVRLPDRPVRRVPSPVARARADEYRENESLAGKASISLRPNRTDEMRDARDEAAESSVPRRRPRLGRIERRPLRRENRVRRLATSDTRERRRNRVTTRGRAVVREAGLPRISSGEAGLPSF